MALDEIEQRCLEFGVSVTLTLEDRELGKELRSLENQIKELIVKINTEFSDSEEYYEIYDLNQKIRMLNARYKRYSNDKIDPINNDSDLQELLKFEFDDIKKELEELKKKVKGFSDVLLKDDSSGLKDLEWEQFIQERAKKKVANVIVTDRAFEEFIEYFLTAGGSKDLSLQAVEGLLRALDALENHVDLMIEDKGVSKKITGSSENGMEYIMTKSRKGGVFRAIYFYDIHKSRVLYSLLFKSEPEEAHTARQEVDDYISQANKRNGIRTNNELLYIRQALEHNNIEVFEKRILLMYKELFRLRKELQKNNMDFSEKSFNEDDDNKQSGGKSI